MPDAQVSEALLRARRRLEAALRQSGRPADATRLMAVSKTQPAERIREAYEAGQRDFGENYLQEALDKQAALAELDATVWHFIGPLQSNKTREVAEHFSWVHSVDRLKIARRLSDQRPAELGPLDICLQVNVSGEASKSGVPPEALEALAPEIAALPNLRLRGLMAIPAPADTPEAQRRPFAQLRESLERLNAVHPELALDTLSMGMSGDLEAAVQEGATWVRLGTAIFGARPPRP